MSNIGFFEGLHFEFVSKIEGHKHNNGIRHEKYHFTDHQSDLTNDSGGVQASFFLWSLAMERSGAKHSLIWLSLGLPPART